MSISRRGALARLAGIAAVVLGVRSAAGEERRPDAVTAVRCCGTCRFLESNTGMSYSYLHKGKQQLSVPLFGWCGLIPRPPGEKRTYEEEVRAFLYLNINDQCNRHFLNVCPSYEVREEDKLW